MYIYFVLCTYHKRQHKPVNPSSAQTSSATRLSIIARESFAHTLMKNPSIQISKSAYMPLNPEKLKGITLLVRISPS